MMIVINNMEMNVTSISMVMNRTDGNVVNVNNMNIIGAGATVIPQWM